MLKKDTSLDDIATSINDLATMVGDQFIMVENQFKQVDKRFDKLESMAHEHTTQIKELQHSNTKIINRLDDLEGRLIALENDIKEIYTMLALSKKSNTAKSKKFINKNIEQQVQLAYKNILQIAKEANVKLHN